MKLRSYEETIKHYKDLFYTQWYGKGLKEKTISFIEQNFVDIEGFILGLGYELLYEFNMLERIYFFKFLRSELWDMGMSLTKNIGCEYYITKRKKEDRFSNFLNYANSTYIDINQEITFIQMITGKSYDEALKIFNKAIEIEPKEDNTPEVKKPIRSKKKSSRKPKEAINTANITKNVEENANNTSELTEVLEKTLVDDDSE